MSSADGGTGDYLPSPPPFPYSYHLLELNVISAQDLFPASRSMRTYAVAWFDPDHRLRTSLDSAGHTDPSWNDKFVYRIPDATLRSSTSALTVEIFAQKGRFLPGKPTLIGTARAIISILRPTTTPRFTALQVRRPASLRPQGILNIGITLVDAYAKSMPLYAGLGTQKAVALKNPADVSVMDATEPKLERKGSVKVASKAAEKERKEVELKLEKWRAELPPLQDGRDRERRAVESKLEKWRAELPPLQDVGEKEKGKWVEGRRRRSFGRLSCLSGAEEKAAGGGGGGLVERGG